MELQVINSKGESAGSSVTLGEAAFGADYNEALIHQVVTAYMAGARAGTRAHKNRSAVAGGGAKPFRQKGTGRARAGTIRSPIWRTGGKTFAATPSDHSQKVNKKMYRAAMRSILSELARQERLVAVDSFELEAPKTKDMAAALNAMGLSNVLVVVEGENNNLELAARNLPHVAVTSTSGLDPVSLVKFEKVVMVGGAVKQVEEMFS